MDLGAITVSLRADLSGLEEGLRRAQELVAASAEGLARQEERFRLAGMAARDYGDGMSRWLGGATGAMGGLGRTTQNLGREWSGAWEAMDRAADAALGRVTRRFGSSVSRMIVDGHGLRDFWQGLWRDLLEIAVQRLAQMVLRTRGAAGDMRDALSAVGGGLFGGVGGLFGDLFGGIFGGIGSVFGKIGDWLGFDNPAHDAWARKQGYDFGRHFRAGVMKAMTLPVQAPPTLGSTQAVAGMRSVGRAAFQAVHLEVERGAVQITAAKLDERTVRDAGAILADEVSRRLGSVERRSGV